MVIDDVHFSVGRRILLHSFTRAEHKNRPSVHKKNLTVSVTVTEHFSAWFFGLITMMLLLKSVLQSLTKPEFPVCTAFQNLKRL